MVTLGDMFPYIYTERYGIPFSSRAIFCRPRGEGRLPRLGPGRVFWQHLAAYNTYIYICLLAARKADGWDPSAFAHSFLPVARGGTGQVSPSVTKCRQVSRSVTNLGVFKAPRRARGTLGDTWCTPELKKSTFPEDATFREIPSRMS